MPPLIELDALEILILVDNEVDPISKYPVDGVTAYGNIADLAKDSPFHPHDRGGGDVRELRMDQICCGAHGLSILITAIKGDQRRTLLFDTGPEEDVWETNVNRLRPDLTSIDLIHLSHWHRDHSGGMLRAIKLINAAKQSKKNTETQSNPKSSSSPQPSDKVEKVTVDLHPSRPDFRGVTLPTFQLSLEPDPTFSEIHSAGGLISLNEETHNVLDDFFLISGFIPRVTSYELGLRRGARFITGKGVWEKDELIADERFVICNIKNHGLVLFTGCSHAGVVNASRHAVELGDGAPLYAVVGGYHLADSDATQISDSVRDLKALNPKILVPGHCTGWRAKYKIEEEMRGRLAPSTTGTRFTLGVEVAKGKGGYEKELV